MPTREQERAQRAHDRVSRQRSDEKRKQEADYQRFAKRFPALIQNCGLAQAIAFAQAKAPEPYLEDLYIASEVVASVAQAGEVGAQEPENTGSL